MVYKNKLVIICKTYDRDLEKVKVLVESINKFNKDGIQFYLSIPESQKSLFSELVKSNKGVNIIYDEDYITKYMLDESIWGLSPGYLNQEICKLAFWETGIAENYIFVDSDAYFIRPFFVADFLYNNTTPYSVLVTDKDLKCQHEYLDYALWRKDQIERIFNEVSPGYDMPIKTCHGMTVLNSRVLEDMKKKYMKNNKMIYGDLLRISPFEYSWYNAWLLKSNVIPVIPIEPLFKTFHTKEEYVLSRLRLTTENDLSKEYVGLILNSNWSGKDNKYKDPTRIDQIIHRGLLFAEKVRL